MDFQLVYVNCTSVDEAENIGRALVGNKWAASANIFQNTTSFYWWEGEFHADQQTTLILKCRTAHLKQVTEKIASMHKYQNPAIVAMAITGGSAEFMD